MRMLVSGLLACSFGPAALSSTNIIPRDAARMTAEAQVNSAATHIHGRSDMMPKLREPGDRTTGQIGHSSEDCADVLVQTRRPDLTTVIERENVCD